MGDFTDLYHKEEAKLNFCISFFKRHPQQNVLFKKSRIFRYGLPKDFLSKITGGKGRREPTVTNQDYEQDPLWTFRNYLPLKLRLYYI